MCDDDDDDMSWQLSDIELTVEVCEDDSTKIFRDSVSVESNKIKLTISKYTSVKSV